MTQSLTFPDIKNITVSGRIASGTTTLAKSLSKVLQWPVLEGGALFEKIHQELGVTEIDVQARPDHFDMAFEEKIKTILTTQSHQIIQSHLAGFDAQGIFGVFKILVVCEDEAGQDKQDIRIDRLVNRKGITVEEAKYEVSERELGNLEKFRRLYAQDDPSWVYWNKSYYDLVVNTYSKDKQAVVETVLHAIEYKRS